MNHRTVSRVVIVAPLPLVWEAVTLPAWVKQWQFGTDLTTDWQPGSPITFRNEWEGTVYLQKGTVLEFEPERRLQYNLFHPRPGLADSPENYFTMTYELKDLGGQTELTITQDDPRPRNPNVPEVDGENTILLGLKRLLEVAGVEDL